MIMTRGDSTYQFRWCYACSFETIKRVMEDQTVNVCRICYLSTELYRIYLVFVHAIDGSISFSWVPYTSSDHRWVAVPHRLRNVRPVRDADLADEDALKQAMQFQMALQWRDSLEGFYTNQPSSEEIRRALGDSATVSTLDYLRYSYYEAEVQEDPEWTGAVQVLCEEGVLLYPYVVNGSDKVLLTHYATLVPESRIGHAFRRGSNILNRVESFVQNLRWSNLRFKLTGGNRNV